MRTVENLPRPVTARTSKAERWLFNAGAILGSLCLVLAALALMFGVKPLIFTSGSMSPAIPTGSLAISVPVAAAEVSAGEVVSVMTHDGVRVTHRVASAHPSDGLVLKGDANAVADLQPYTGASVDRVLFSVPALGYVAAWFSSPWLLVLGGSLCAYLIYGAFFRRSTNSGNGSADGEKAVSVNKQGTRRRTRRRTWLGIGAIVTALALVVPLGLSAKVEATEAAWTADAVVGSSIAAAIVPPAGPLMCTSNADAQVADISWTAPANSPVPVASYTITVTISGKSNSEVLPGGQTSKRLSMRDGSSLLGAVLGLLVDLVSLLVPYDYPVSVSVTTVYANGWESVPQSYPTMRAFNGGLLGGGKQLRC